VEYLKTAIGKLQSSIDKLESNVKILDNKCNVVISTVPFGAAAPKVTSAAPNAKDEVVDGGDANVDLFGSDSEEESNDAKKKTEGSPASVICSQESQKSRPYCQIEYNPGYKAMGL